MSAANRFRIIDRNQIAGPGVPVAVQGLIYANLAMFTLMAAWGAWAGFGTSVLLRPDTRLLLHMGAQFWPAVLNEGDWWRCITYAFCHGGLIHLGFNMYVLYQVGPMLERELGWPAFLFLYLATALTATALGLFWHPRVPVVGASGAIFGLFGFSISFYHRIGSGMAIARRNFLLQWAFISLLFGFMVGADNAGHLGGLVGGALIGLVMPIYFRELHRLRPLLAALGWISLVAIATAHLGLVASWFWG
jgi:rhomboid protease GluP